LFYIRPPGVEYLVTMRTIVRKYLRYMVEEKDNFINININILLLIENLTDKVEA